MFRKGKNRTSANSSSRSSSDEQGSEISQGNTLTTGTSSSMLEGSLYRINQYEVFFLGMVQDVNLGGRSAREPDIQLLDKVEESQLEGKVQLVAREEDLVVIMVSKQGIKVLSRDRMEILQRHPLHTVAQIIQYQDSFNKANVAVKIGKVGHSVYDCYVFQCDDEDQAKMLCQSLKGVFDIISHRAA